MLERMITYSVGGVLAVFVVLQVLLTYNIAKRSDRVRLKLRRTKVALLVYAGGIIILRSMKYSDIESVVGACSVALAVTLLLVRPEQRSRRIPAAVRRQVIERDLGREPYDGTRHHIDHIVPFSRGGDNSPENLRVVEKRQNLRRGAKMPTLRDFFQ